MRTRMTLVFWVASPAQSKCDGCDCGAGNCVGQGRCNDHAGKTVSPSNADDQTGTWTSSNPAIATVDTKGVVRGVAAGNATVTFVTKDGGFSAKSTVTVTAS
jgi:hypothetical protein